MAQTTVYISSLAQSYTNFPVFLSECSPEGHLDILQSITPVHYINGIMLSRPDEQKLALEDEMKHSLQKVGEKL